ncbi:DUF748 domain-containing protein [Pseudomonas sp. RIT-To-2]|uniref:DUF748 domain-containing protein n=1 Tax=Pseudomonas sp. RIT-To-2 TaxID=3462541 RepID=UPI002413797F
MPKGLLRALAAVLTLIALYSLLGFLILPGIGLRIANQQLAKYASVPAHLERLEFNPFSLELTVWGLHIGEPGIEQVGFERLYANLQIDSLWTKALHLEAVELDKPRTELLFNKDGSLNLAQLFKLPPNEPAKPDEPASKPFPLRIGSIKLNEGYLHFKDVRPSEPIEFLYNSMNLELKNLSTLPEDNADMTMVAAGPDGGQIDWKGRISLVPITSEGSLKVTDARMKVWWPYVRDALPLALQDGILNLSTDYSLNLSKDTQLNLTNASVSVAPFALNAPDGRPLVKLERLDVSETSVDLAKQLVTVGKIRSSKLETWAAREADGQLDWQKLFATPKAPPPPAQKTTPATADAKPETQPVPSAPSKPWQVLLKDVQLRDYQVHLADRMQKEPVALELGPLNVDVQNFDSLNQSPFTLKLDTGLGKQGKISASGEVNLAPVTARLKVNTQDIDLRVAQAYITPFIRLELRSGRLGSDLAVNLKNIDPLTLSITGSAKVDQLQTLDTLKGRDFVKWENLQLDGLDYEHGASLSIDKVTLTQPYARFMINEDRTTSVNDLLIPQAQNPQAQANAKPAAASKPMAIHVGGVSINGGSAYFGDFSLKPNFATNIQDLTGTIGTIDSQQQKPAKVDIKGKVDRYAPVTIAGALTPFDPMASLDIDTRFNRLELTTLTPYSGKFAGYRIRKGRMNLELHYVITKGQLKAENKVLVDQLELGEKVDSPDAVSLPVKLAIALLKDVNGQINIELPITGDLNNPQFSVMPIVWQTLRNLVVKAVAAPFKLLGSLVSGGDSTDLSNIAFAPGSSDLSPSAQANLLKLAAGLKSRPGLHLEVAGATAASSDGPLVAQQRLELEYQTNYFKILQRRGDKVPANANLLTVPEDEKAPMLAAIYRTQLNQQPPAAWDQLEKKQREANLRDAVIKSWASSEPLLRALGQARAAAIKAFLVDKGQLPDEKVFLIDTVIGDAQKDGSVVTDMQVNAD